MPYATEADHDGPIYLNRIYRVYLNSKSNVSVNVLINELSSLSSLLLIIINFFLFNGDIYIFG